MKERFAYDFSSRRGNPKTERCPEVVAHPNDRVESTERSISKAWEGESRIGMREGEGRMSRLHVWTKGPNGFRNRLVHALSGLDPRPRHRSLLDESWRVGITWAASIFCQRLGLRQFGIFQILRLGPLWISRVPRSRSSVVRVLILCRYHPGY